MTVTRRASGQAHNDLLVQKHAWRTEITIERLEYNLGHFTDFGREWMREAVWIPSPEGIGIPCIAGGSGFSTYAEQKAVNHANGQATWSAVAGSYLALITTTIPTATSTGSSITEATYGGYARQSVGGNWTAAALTAGVPPAVGVNTATITFAACTSSTSTLIAFALCDAITVGNMIWWGTLSSTVISVTQTPATVAAGVLQTSLT